MNQYVSDAISMVKTALPRESKYGDDLFFQCMPVTFQGHILFIDLDLVVQRWIALSTTDCDFFNCGIKTRKAVTPDIELARDKK